MSIAVQSEFCCYLRVFLLVIICGVPKRRHYRECVPNHAYSAIATLVNCCRTLREIFGYMLDLDVSLYMFYYFVSV